MKRSRASSFTELWDIDDGTWDIDDGTWDGIDDGIAHKAARALDDFMVEDIEEDDQETRFDFPFTSLRMKRATKIRAPLSTPEQSLTPGFLPSPSKKRPVSKRSAVFPFSSGHPMNESLKHTLHSPTSKPSSFVDSRKICKLEGCTKPVYVEDERVHEYCGYTHSLQATGRTKAGDVPEELVCSTPGCKRPKYKNPKGAYFDYCSMKCRDGRRLSLPAVPVVKEVCRVSKASRDDYQRYSQQFLTDWIKGNSPPIDSISVFMITNPVLKRKWQEYKGNLSDTTIERHYHGTKLCCNISSLQLCSNKSCGICDITQNSFDRSLIGSNISGFKRFGSAFYLAPHSSKCHDYTVGYGEIRAMLCFQTLPGNKYKLKKTNKNFVLPPDYDSAYGVPGDSLNYPELLLYNSEAALPVCIFTYKKDGITQIAK